MFRCVRRYWRRRAAVLGGVVVIGAAAGVGAYFLIDSLRGNDNGETAPAPAPTVVVKKQQPQAAQDLGFPAFATKNTTRVSGADAVADASGVALAVFPSTGGTDTPAAVSFVTDTEWQSGIAAASLAAPPVSAPILISGSNGIPSLTTDALTALDPRGSPETDGAQILRIGQAMAPSGLQTANVPGSNPAEIAAGVDRLRQKLVGSQPKHVLLASSENAADTMPAAAWAARSGDPVLFVHRDSVPRPTMDALRQHKNVPVYALGPASAISDKALAEVERVSPGVKRVGASDPVKNAIAFARYDDGTFGWNINDPGHGFVIARTSQPLDAAAAAPLSASGNWGPLLITTDPAQVPAALRGYLLDLKPGYISDPTRAVYNHIWLIGDQSAISTTFQGQVDELAEVAKVRSGTGKQAAPQAPAPAAPKAKTPNPRYR
jgi:ell wall binding domain 2 (CWB2)